MINEEKGFLKENKMWGVKLEEKIRWRRDIKQTKCWRGLSICVWEKKKEVCVNKIKHIGQG